MSNQTTFMYEWASRNYAISAQVVGETVERLGNLNGGFCPPSALVEEARPDDHELHILFEWDDSVAAEAHRRQQARQVINSVRVVPAIEDGSAPAPSFPAFVSVTKVDENGVTRGYRPLSVVVDQPDEYRQVLAEANAAFAALRRRFAALKEFGPVFEALDQLDLGL